MDSRGGSNDAGFARALNHCRPCVWVSCRHHLYLEVLTHGNSLDCVPYVRINAPGEPWELTESCALDVADQGEQTLELVGDRLHITRERIRQLEAKALRHAQARMRRMQVGDELREAIGGDRSRPDLNDANQSTMNVPLLTAADQVKLRAVKPDVTVYRRETPRQAQNENEPRTGDTMAKNTETKQSTAHTVSAAVLEHINKLRALHWTWGDIAKGSGYSDSGLHNLIRGARAMSTETEAKILAIPLEERKPFRGRKEKKPAPVKKPARTAKPAPTPAPSPRTETPAPQTAVVNVGWEMRTPSPVLARLDAEIEEAKQAADHIYQRLSVLRELRTKWAQEGA